MNRDWPEPKDKYNRLDTDLAEKDPADREEQHPNDIERRDTITGIIDSVEPSRPVGPDEAVYGDTDLHPNADDVKDEHGAGPDDVA